MKRTERDAIEELAQLLDGELSPDEVGAPLRRLGTLVATIGETEVVERPTPAIRAALRNQLVADIQAGRVTAVGRVRDAVWDRTARVRHSARVAVASAVAAGMLGSAGVAAAAQHALPTDTLYGIKRVTETVRLSLASGLREEARVQLAIAEERLEELSEARGRLSIDDAVDSLERMDAASLAASDALIQAVAEGEDADVLTELVGFTERQRSGLIELYGGLPVAARPFADASLEVLRRIEIDVATTLGPCGVCAQIASGAALAEVTPGDGIDSRDCECLDPVGAPPPREPAVTVPSGPLDPPADGSDPDDDEAASVSVGSNAPDVIPSLPRPLDDLGDAIDDALGDIAEAATAAGTGGAVVDDEEPVGVTVDDVAGLLDPVEP